MSYILAKNLAETFHQRVQRSPDKAAILRKKQGHWSSLSWRDMQTRVPEFDSSTRVNRNKFMILLRVGFSKMKSC
jgi:long-subunit acyl-CoA synthetase (AMP-forming)